MFQALIESNKGLLAAALANNNQSVPTQSLVNTYHQPGNLQRNYSYNGFNWLFFHNYFNIVTNVLMQWSTSKGYKKREEVSYFLK